MTRTSILIVDDEPALVDGLTEFLEDEGFSVHQALEGRAGLGLFRSLRPEMVLTDLKMPGLPGMSLIGEIRKIDKNVPIIVITGYGTMDAAIDAIRLDVFDFITKPIDLDYLKVKLDDARVSMKASQDVQKNMLGLQEQLALVQMEWKEQMSKLSEVEPLIQTGRLLAAVLHNLNNPLTYIMGQSQLLYNLHPEMENLKLIQDQALRMRKIIGTIAKRVRVSQKREQEWLQLNELVQEELYFLESHPYLKHDVEKEWQLDMELPPVRGIAIDFCQVFGNLLRNAIEAMHGMSVKRITLRSWHNADGIHVSIADTGHGIPEPLMARIFQPFFSTKTFDVGMAGGFGMGIGLYHCRELIQQYGGWIEVTSQPNVGSEFTVHLPATEANLTH